MSKKSYKILVIKHLLKGNKMAKSGDIVDGSKFINLQKSIDGGYVEEYNDDTSKNKAKNKAKNKDKDVDLKIDDFKVDGKIEPLKMKSLNKTNLKTVLSQVEGFKFDESDSKGTLIKSLSLFLSSKTENEEEE